MQNDNERTCFNTTIISSNKLYCESYTVYASGKHNWLDYICILYFISSWDCEGIQEGVRE